MPISMSLLTQILLWYFAAINGLALLLFAADKVRAREGKWRISEKALLLTALLGGSVGALLGMRLFHHKTLHARFKYGIPAMLALQLAVAGWLVMQP